MTAEIAVINRNAVVLAADSAVTITDGANTKIYQSENKLFEISDSHPVGLMVYNVLEFYGVPFELISKDFRLDCGANNKAKIFDWKDEFIRYLESENYKPSALQELNHFKKVTKKFLDNIFQEIKDLSFREYFLQEGKNKTSPSLPATFDKMFNKVLDKNVDIYINLNTANVFINKDDIAARFLDQHRKELDKFINDDCFTEMSLSDEHLVRIYELLSLTIVKQRATEICTGFVFAGFGSDEIFPSVDHIIIDGCFCGNIKWFSIDEYDVDRHNNRGTVIAFAQPDVAHRFLYGVDDNLEAQIANYFCRAFSKLPEVLEEGIKGIGEKLTEDINITTKNYIRSIRSKFEQTTSSSIKNMFFSSIEDMVQLMPKQEMAELAEALINITTLKRRVSNEQETVGGPIDVAVISRHEGFVWVKRKHYFSSEFNQRYFWRKFNSNVKLGDQGNDYKS